MNAEQLHIRFKELNSPEGLAKCKAEAKHITVYLFDVRHLDLAEISVTIKMLDETIEEVLKEKGRE